MRTSVWAKRVQNRMAATGEGGMFAMEHDGDHDGLCTPSDVKSGQVEFYRGTKLLVKLSLKIS
jgi:hypothetical protein